MIQYVMMTDSCIKVNIAKQQEFDNYGGYMELIGMDS